MSIYEESGFRLDFTAAMRSHDHDRLYHASSTKVGPTTGAPDGNTIWDGVDFRIVEHNREVWIEIKSWSFKAILDRTERKSAKRDFARKSAEAVIEFRDKIFAKFLGATSFLAWSRIGVPESVHYVVFLEPPDRGSEPLLVPFQEILREKFKNVPKSTWGRRIRFSVVTMEEFKQKFPNYPIQRI